MAKAVKLADIAEQVGVSTVTVSKALSGQKGVSEEMREKIKNLAEELGYRSFTSVHFSQLFLHISEDAGIKSTMNARTFSRTNMNKRWKMIYDLLSGYGQ